MVQNKVVQMNDTRHLRHQRQHPSMVGGMVTHLVDNGVEGTKATDDMLDSLAIDIAAGEDINAKSSIPQHIHQTRGIFGDP